MSLQEHDLVIIGGGPGGYVCAIRAAQLGLDTAIVEKRPGLGGTCINVGCIPSKALLDSSHKYEEGLHQLAAHGIESKSLSMNVSKMMARKDKIVQELVKGLDFLMQKNKIRRYHAEASLQKQEHGRSLIQLAAKGQKKQLLSARRCVIATGSQTTGLGEIVIDGRHIISSDQAIALEKVPKRLLIIGGGVIGLELGSVWRRLGAEVSIVEALPSILMGIDKQTRDLALGIFRRQGLNFLLEHKLSATKILAKNKGVEALLIDAKGKKITLQADTMLVAVGRRPYTEGLGLENIGIQTTPKGHIPVDPQSLESSLPGIYAIGDVIEGPMLAHRAEEEGMMLAERLADKASPNIGYGTIPWIIYTWPEIAWVGRLEDELKAASHMYNAGRCLFRPNGRAKAMNESQGQVKILADKHDDRLLGCSIIGPHASELIGQITLAMEFGASAEDLARSCFAHPTLGEVIKEAALDVDKRALHA